MSLTDLADKFLVGRIFTKGFCYSGHNSRRQIAETIATNEIVDKTDWTRMFLGWLYMGYRPMQIETPPVVPPMMNRRVVAIRSGMLGFS